jgi:hypothetical protein
MRPSTLVGDGTVAESGTYETVSGRNSGAVVYSLIFSTLPGSGVSGDIWDIGDVCGIGACAAAGTARRSRIRERDERRIGPPWVLAPGEST